MGADVNRIICEITVTAKIIPIIDTNKYLLFIFRYFEIKGEMSRISSSPTLFLKDV